MNWLRVVFAGSNKTFDGRKLQSARNFDASAPSFAQLVEVAVEVRDGSKVSGRCGGFKQRLETDHLSMHASFGVVVQ